MSRLRRKAVHGLRPGDEFVIKRTFSKEETEEFGDLTRDYNPVHYDRGWTDLKRFPDLICHGLLVGGMICEFGGQVGWLATGMNFRFLKPVYFDEEITLTVTLEDVQADGRARAAGVFVNPDGDSVARVELHGRLPVNEEKEYLDQMVQKGDPTNKLAEF